MRRRDNSPIYTEVLGYRQLGIDIFLNGRNIESCDRGIYSLKENTCYMREYIRNGEGDLEKVNFTLIRKK